MAKVETIEERIRYYDFIMPGDQERNIKLPAGNVHHAVYMYALYVQAYNFIGNPHYNSRFKFEINTKTKDYTISHVRSIVRKIIEYKKTSTNGRTQPRFKRVGVYYIGADHKIRSTDFK